MKNLSFTINKNIAMFAVVGCLSVGLLGASKLSQNNSIRKMSLSSGVGTCFQRVSQTFTALMIRDFTSSYLTTPFLDTTSECFSYANKEFKDIFAKNMKGASSAMTALVSDLHWFQQKATKLVKMSEESGIDLSNSNIINKYSSLEGLKDSFQEKINKEVQSNNSSSDTLYNLSIASFIAFFGLLANFAFQRFRSKELFAKIENESAKAIESNSEFVSANVERAFDNILRKVNMPKTYTLFNKYHADLLEKAYRSFESEEGIEIDGVHAKTTETEEVKTETSYYQDAMGNVLDGLSQKVFTHGIKLDTDLEDDFYIKGETELVEQVLYNVLNLAFEKCTEGSGAKAIEVTSKPLGGTAYLKVVINNYLFNAEELNFTNSSSDSHANVDLNLVLMSEMIKDLGAKVSIKNKVSATHSSESSEIEVIFERVQESKKVQSVVKGTKREILRSLSMNA